MFEKIKSMITDEAALSEITSLETKFTNIKSEFDKNEKKLVDVISSRDKYKNFTKTLKTKLNFEDGEELNSETINEKIEGLTKKVSTKSSEIEETLKKDIDNLKNQLKENNDKYEGIINSKEKEIFKTKFDIKAKDSLKNLELQNDKAYDLLYSELVSNVEFDEDTKDFVYKNEDGTVKRNEDGSAVSVSQKAEQIKTSDDFSFLFKANIQNGSGTENGSASSSSEMSDFERIANM